MNLMVCGLVSVAISMSGQEQSVTNERAEAYGVRTGSFLVDIPMESGGDISHFAARYLEDGFAAVWWDMSDARAAMTPRHFAFRDTSDGKTLSESYSIVLDDLEMMTVDILRECGEP